MQDDAALVARCRQGDQEAVHQLVARFQPVVLALCRRLLGDEHEAEDAAQETLWRMLRHLERWDASRPLQPWVLQIAVNRCRTILSQRTRRPLPSEWEHTWPAPTSRSPHELVEELQRGMQTLREEYRLCLELLYRQQMPVEEMARLLNVPIGTIKTWLYRARRELADYLQQHRVVNEHGQELYKF